jgi:hypothetical protein
MGTNLHQHFEGRNYRYAKDISSAQDQFILCFSFFDYYETAWGYTAHIRTRGMKETPGYRARRE